MKIAIGADHRGFQKKEELKPFLKKQGHEVADVGAHSSESCDYPEIGHRLALTVARGDAERGILVCMSGIGMSIVANKTKGIRAALCHNLKFARLSRQHNDANVLVLSAEDLTEPMEAVVDAWLKTPFEGGRHERRVKQIGEIEERQCK